MRVKELLAVLTDESVVNIWQDGDIVAFYDGKNSIDDEFNDEFIKSVSTGFYKIDIEI